MTVNSGANTAAASSGLFLPVGSSAGGATGTNEVDVFNSGVSGNCGNPSKHAIVSARGGIAPTGYFCAAASTQCSDQYHSYPSINSFGWYQYNDSRTRA